MGNDVKCQLGESEEEIIERACYLIPFKEYDCYEVYNELKKAIIENERPQDKASKNNIKHIQKNSISFNPEKIHKYLEEVINKENNPLKEIHMKYFESILTMENSVLIMSTILILISKGERDSKAKFLSELYQKSNKLIDKDCFKYYIKDIIQANTTNCVEAFKELLDRNKNVYKLEIIYNETRKQKLCDYIMSNYNITYNGIYKDIPISDSIVVEDDKSSSFFDKLFDLIVPSIKGDFIRNWLSEEFEKDFPANGDYCFDSQDY